MRVLITGADGFVGYYLREELSAHGHEPLGLSGPPAPGQTPVFPVVDLRDESAIVQQVAALKPDACIHLAGIASNPVCEKHPALAMAVNVSGTINLLNAFAAHAPHARLLLISSTQVYGPQASENPIHEDSPRNPQTIYAISKDTMERSAAYFAACNSQDVMIARPENHIGPGQSAQYVVMAFARQLADMSSDEGQPTMRTGNLESTRDFSDVRDMVRAYRLLLEKGKAGETYNIASGKPRTIQYLLDQLIAISGQHPKIEADPALYRPTERAVEINSDKIKAHTGWSTTIPLEQTLQEIYTSLQTGS